MTERVITLDVREDIREGREPFSRIIQTAAGLHNGEALLLVAPFEPVPLYRILARQGFSYKCRSTGTGDWEVLFSRGPAAETADNPAANEPLQATASACKAAPIVEVDARGLEPPQRLARILEALPTLPPGAQLHARTDFHPMHLYGQLEERGFDSETQSLEDGSFLTRIRRR